MNRKTLSTTGIQLPELALGTWQYRGGVESLKVGIALGANFIDTAESYETEEVVGQAIRGIRDQVFLATKISPRHFRRAEVIKAAEASLRKLQTEHIDLYQLHWPNYWVPIAETMGAMEDLVRMGKVRFIGVSNYSAAELEKAQATLSTNRIVSNQVRYSLVDRTIDYGLRQYCEANQITILAFSPLAHSLGFLREYDRGDLLGRISIPLGRTRAQVALNWCIAHPSVVAIFKANRIEHVRENCGASGWYLQPDQMRILNDRVGFKRRGRIERFARRLARQILQRFGRNI
jgi:diketogulonate reductase-like aldo/keto reductase